MQLKALWPGALLVLLPTASQGGPAASPTATPTPTAAQVWSSHPAPQAVLLNGKPFPAVAPFTVSLPPPARTRFVSPAKENGDGSEARPWNDLQEAFCALSPGDRLRVLPGTYTGEFRVAEPCADGTRRAPIQVLFDGKARLVPHGEAPAFTVRRAHWLFVGLFLELGQSAGPGVSIEGAAAHDVTLDGARISGGSGPGIRIGEDTVGIQVANSRIAKSRLAQAAAASFGIEIAAGARDVLVTNNQLHENPAGSVRVEAPAAGGLPATGLRLVGNAIRDDAATAIDVEAADRLRIVDNSISDASGAAETRGISLGRVHLAFVQSNHVSDCEIAIQVGSAGPGGETFPADDVLIDHNYLESAFSAGAGIRIDAGNRVRVANNVVDRFAEAIQILGGPPRTRAVSVVNNLVLGVSRLAFTLDDRKAVELFDYNVFSPAARTVNVRLGDRELALSEFLKGGAMPHSSLVSGVRILHRDLARIDGVETVDRGKSIEGIPQRGAAPDIGVEER